MTNNSEHKDESKKNTRKLPSFYSDIIAALLVSYSTSAEPMRYIVACDLFGYVKAAIKYCRLNDVVENDSEKSYSSLMDDSLNILNAAVQQFKTGEMYLGNEYLNQVMNTLKQIIIDNNFITPGWSYVSNPLGTASVDLDRVQNSRYKEI